MAACRRAGSAGFPIRLEIGDRGGRPTVPAGNVSSVDLVAIGSIAECRRGARSSVVSRDPEVSQRKIVEPSVGGPIARDGLAFDIRLTRTYFRDHAVIVVLDRRTHGVVGLGRRPGIAVGDRGTANGARATAVGDPGRVHAPGRGLGGRVPRPAEGASQPMGMPRADAAGSGSRRSRVHASDTATVGERYDSVLRALCRRRAISPLCPLRASLRRVAVGRQRGNPRDTRVADDTIGRRARSRTRRSSIGATPRSPLLPFG